MHQTQWAMILSVWSWLITHTMKIGTLPHRSGVGSLRLRILRRAVLHRYGWNTARPCAHHARQWAHAWPAQRGYTLGHLTSEHCQERAGSSARDGGTSGAGCFTPGGFVPPVSHDVSVVACLAGRCAAVQLFPGMPEWRTPATFFEPRSECRGCYRHGCASARSRASMRPPRRVSCPAAHAAAGAHSRAAGCRPAWRRWRYITLACMSLLRAPAHKACKSPILTINVPQEKALSTVHGKFAYKTLGPASCRRHVLFVHGLGSSSGPVFQVSTLLRHAVHAACTIHPSSMRAHTLHPQITFCTTASSVLFQDTRSRAQTSLPLNCRWYQRVLLSFSLLLSLSLSLALSREHTLTSTHTYTRAHIHTLSFKCCALAHTECAYVLTRALAPHPPHRMHAGSFQTY